MIQRILFLSLFCSLISGCFKTQPSLEIPSCHVQKIGETGHPTYYKLVGSSDSQYSVRTCSEDILRQQQAEIETRSDKEVTLAELLDHCFASDITQVDFKAFEAKSLIPILCTEIR